jgi:hypothetical protein
VRWSTSRWRIVQQVGSSHDLTNPALRCATAEQCQLNEERWNCRGHKAIIAKCRIAKDERYNRSITNASETEGIQQRPLGNKYKMKCDNKNIHHDALRATLLVYRECFFH